MEVLKKDHPLTVSVSPHVRSEESVARIMWTVNVALLPAFVMGLYFFGPRALYVTAVCIVSCVVCEFLYQKGLNKKIMISDGSAVLTGLLLGMNLPPTTPFYISIVGSLAAIVITKQIFGGLGFNIFNPALIGRAFVLISWPRAMTTWSEPTAAFFALDAETTATPLGILKEDGLAQLLDVFGDKINVYTQLLIGNVAGSIGEVSAIAILAGGIFLMYKKYITWHIPASYLGTVAVLAWIFGGEGFFTGDPIIHLFGGGLMLGAFFMATDYVTCPSVRLGQIIFGIGCGAITMLIRLKGGFPEGVMFAILLMNCFAPMIDRQVKRAPFGMLKVKKEQAQ
jgi:electron transport complex protein RnfD